MSIQKKIWAEHQGQFYLTTPSVEHQELKNQVYTVKQNPQTGEFYLVEVCEKYTFDYKLYGLEAPLIKRVLKSWEAVKGNMGMLLNGVKGTGKTVSSKIIANELNQPTIVVTTPYKGVQYFINSIPQNITVFIDEYEKIYGQSNDMLTIMDGAMNSPYRRMFLLTTNKLYIEDNLKQRPSRLRYIKKFEDLAPSVVEEIVDDILEYKEFREDCLKFMTTLSLITVDIVKSVISEVNIHCESPFEFGDVFNVSKIDGKYKLFELDAKTGKQGPMLADNANIYPRPDYKLDEHEGHWFEVNNQSVGRISAVLGEDMIAVDIVEYNDETVNETIVFKVARSYGTHSNYAWGDNGQNANAIQTNDRLETLMGNDPKLAQKRRKKRNSLSKLKLNLKEKAVSMPSPVVEQAFEKVSEAAPVGTAIAVGHTHEGEADCSEGECESAG